MASTAPRPTPIPRRVISGGASVIVPVDELGDPAWDTFARHLDRIGKLGLTPALSMTMGNAELLRTDLQVGAIYQAEEVLGGGDFYAGVHVLDEPGDWCNVDRYLRQAEVVVKHGGVPIIFPSHGLRALPDGEWLNVMGRFGDELGRFIAGDMVITDPHGPWVVGDAPLRSDEVYVDLLRNQRCLGVAHRSGSRAAEWDRLQRHRSLRPDFRLLSLNEYAVDMAVYGSDYLLFGAALVPELFARRDALWSDGDRSFHELNDALQFLSTFISRPPIAAVAHSALQFMALRGWVDHSAPPRDAALRPDADVAVLRTIAARLGVTARPVAV